MPKMSPYTSLRSVMLVGTIVTMGGCQTYQAPSQTNPLAGMDFVLIEYKAPTASAPTEVPLYRYTLNLGKDGTARAKLDCNNATARWSATGTGPGEGAISFSKVAATMALCPEGSLGEQLAADLPQMKSWSLYDGRLTIKTEPVGPEYVWDTVD